MTHSERQIRDAPPDLNLAPIALVLLIVAAVATLAAVVESWPRGVGVTFLAVGNADCVVVRVASGRTVLIDGGGGERFGARSDVLLSYLMARGIRRLDGIILTGGSRQDVGQIPDVVQEVPVGALFSPEEVATTDFGRKARVTCEIAEVPLCTLEDGQQFNLGDGATMSVRLWRQEGAPCAVGLRVAHEDVSLLFVDVNDEKNARLLANAPPAPADVFKVAEQGQAWANPPELLDAIRPQFAVISRAVGGASAEDPTSVRVVGRLNGLGAEILSTHLAGAITARLDGTRVRVKTFLRK